MVTINLLGDETEDEKIMIDGKEVKSVDVFCYLGSSIKWQR